MKNDKGNLGGRPHRRGMKFPPVQQRGLSGGGKDTKNEGNRKMGEVKETRKIQLWGE